eukprot:TRINITY_DN7278_c0_g1_i1.p1 TRINITY_DN7278_c0_g1~~TRINITY_DN7278_c0_g1_i1.p1  ORF type:complete len:1450 (+),score=548.82 TRINITY_DN7278_c0_g1_i1:46-4395(+)
MEGAVSTPLPLSPSAAYTVPLPDGSSGEYVEPDDEEWPTYRPEEDDSQGTASGVQLSDDELAASAEQLPGGERAEQQGGGGGPGGGQQTGGGQQADRSGEQAGSGGDRPGSSAMPVAQASELAAAEHAGAAEPQEGSGSELTGPGGGKQAGPGGPPSSGSVQAGAADVAAGSVQAADAITVSVQAADAAAGSVQAADTAAAQAADAAAGSVRAGAADVAAGSVQAADAITVSVQAADAAAGSVQAADTAAAQAADAVVGSVQAGPANGGQQAGPSNETGSGSGGDGEAARTAAAAAPLPLSPGGERTDPILTPLLREAGPTPRSEEPPPGVSPLRAPRKPLRVSLPAQEEDGSQPSKTPQGESPRSRMRLLTKRLVATCRVVHQTLSEQTRKAQTKAAEAELTNSEAQWISSPVSPERRRSPVTRWRTAIMAAGFVSRLKADTGVAAKRSELSEVFHSQRAQLEGRILALEADITRAMLAAAQGDATCDGEAILEMHADVDRLWKRLWSEHTDYLAELERLSEEAASSPPSRRGTGHAGQLQQDRRAALEAERAGVAAEHAEVVSVWDKLMEERRGGDGEELSVLESVLAKEKARAERRLQWNQTMLERTDAGDVPQPGGDKLAPAVARAMAGDPLGTTMDSDPLSCSQVDTAAVDKLQRYEELRRLEQKLDERRKAAREVSKEVDLRAAELERRADALAQVEGRAMELRTKGEELNARADALSRKQRALGCPEDREHILEQRKDALTRRRAEVSALFKEFVLARREFDESKVSFSAAVNRDTEACETTEGRLRAEEADLRQKLADCEKRKDSLLSEFRVKLESSERQWAAGHTREQQLLAEREELHKQRDELANRRIDWSVKEAHRIEQVEKAEALKESIKAQEAHMKSRVENLRKAEQASTEELDCIQRARTSEAERKYRLEKQAAALRGEALCMKEHLRKTADVSQQVQERVEVLDGFVARADEDSRRLAEYDAALADRGEQLQEKERRLRAQQRRVARLTAKLRRADRDLDDRARGISRRRTSVKQWAAELRWRDGEISLDESEAQPGSAGARPCDDVGTQGPKRAYLDRLQRRRVESTEKMRRRAAHAIVMADCKRLKDDFTPTRQTDSCFTVSAALPLHAAVAGRDVGRKGKLLGDCDKDVLRDGARRCLEREVAELTAAFAARMAAVHATRPAALGGRSGQTLLQTEDKVAQLRQDSLLLQELRRCPLIECGQHEAAHRAVFFESLWKWWEGFSGQVLSAEAEGPREREADIRETLELLADLAPESVRDDVHPHPAANPQELRRERLRRRLADADALLAQQEQLPVAALAGAAEEEKSGLQEAAPRSRQRPVSRPASASPRWRRAARLLCGSAVMSPEIAAAETAAGEQASSSDSTLSAGPSPIASAQSSPAMSPASNTESHSLLAPLIATFRPFSEDPEYQAILSSEKQWSPRTTQTQPAD